MIKLLPLTKESFVGALIVMFSFFLSTSVIAQQRTIKGTVVDETGSPLPGVAVVIQGTTQGTTTDFDGKFAIDLNETAKFLEFSYIGYQKKVAEIGTTTNFDIALDVDAEQLEEVLVIGYGSTTKKDATGSVEAVTADSFNKGAINSPQGLLQGKVAGVQITTGGGAPGSGSTIRIRSGSSLSASNDPLIVIDGVPVDSDGVSGMRNPLNAINPADIESMTVLKDASATAIYGSRASNGVIIITTKKGATNESSINVNYNGSVSINTLNDQVDVLSADQYRQMMSGRPGEHLLGDANTNWQSEVMNTSVSTDHNVGVSGNVKGWLPYRASVGYTLDNGTLDGSSMDRTTMNLNLSPSLLDDHLKINASVKGMFVNNKFGNTGAIGSAVSYDPTQPVYDDRFPQYGGYHTWTNTSDPASGRSVNAPSNPMAMVHQNSNTSNVNRSIGNAQFDYKVHGFEDLTFKVNAGYDYSSSKGGVYEGLETSWNENNGPAGSDEKGGYVSDYTQTKRNELLDVYAQYNKEIGKHKFDVMGGYSWQHFYEDGTSVESNAYGYKTKDQTWATEYYLVSFFGRANYTFNEKYMATVTVRQDGTSRFSPNNRWGTFPSLALAWKIKEEPWMQGVTAVSDLKLRAGVGVTGQQNIGAGNYPYMPTYTVGDANSKYGFYNPTTGQWEYINTTRPEGYDENIKWEETITYNAGFDYGLFNDRVTGSLEGYYRVTNDLLNVIPVPGGSNLTNMLLTNVGSMENKGVEFSVNTKIIQKQDMHWDFGVNMTWNDSKITKLTLVDDPNYEGVKVGGIAGGTGETIQIHREGYTPYSFLVYEQIYDDNGKPIEGAYVDRNGDGVIDEKDKYIAGDPMANFYLGFSTRFMYKNWEFSMSARAQFGAQVYNNVDSNNSAYDQLYVSANNNTNNVTTDIYNTGFQTRQLHSDYYIQDANFLRIDNIMVGYNFNNLFGGKTSARVFGTVNNPCVFSNYKGVDPEIQGGIDNNMYPRPTTYMLGFNVNF
ncbi:SusC/RagA family TonB-linked outer membrane protein [Flammeovirga agarivorans]|uniref:TonB-dependent receptor n=1 Tax=Flammeovirga agarivorans TaxID=2726742 RepID=A0A7X8SHN6_9BACT|nr:TonB-dependent receptor [Flammeovirga agarivorans]NLR90381.1 TonB-dependent receptor [Flammeovirga agarivorans]